MSELWFNNPKILLKNLDEFFPDNDLNFIKKINAIIRFSIYYTLIIIIFNYDINYLFISLILILISYFLGNYVLKYYETFNNKQKNNNTCQKPNENNPFMNYTVGDLIDNNNKLEACKYDDVKDEMRQEFRKNIFTDSSDLWGKYISDRNFYTMPNTEIINKQREFAEWCYGGHGECKSLGTNCLKER